LPSFLFNRLQSITLRLPLALAEIKMTPVVGLCIRGWHALFLAFRGDEIFTKYGARDKGRISVSVERMWDVFAQKAWEGQTD